MEVEQFFKLGPKNHSYLTEIALQSRTALLSKRTSVLLIHCQHQQHSVDIESSSDCLPQLLKEKLYTWPEKRTKEFSSAIRANIEEISSKENFMEHTVNQSLVERLKGLL